MLKLFKDKWNIGFIRSNSNKLMSNNFRLEDFKIKWLKEEKDYFYADPFIAFYNNKYIILCERFSYKKNMGEIFFLELVEDSIFLGKKLDIFDNKHVSYPFLFKDKGNLYLLPETKSLGTQSIYLYDEKLCSFKKIAKVFDNNIYSDPSIIFYNNYYWIFASIRSNLFIWYSLKIEGSWKEHPKNPFIGNLETTRNGGDIFMDNNKVYRFTQNISSDYGSNISLKKILSLNENRFTEEKISDIFPDSSNKFGKGLHNLSFANNVIIFDCKRKVLKNYNDIILKFRNDKI